MIVNNIQNFNNTRYLQRTPAKGFHTAVFCGTPEIQDSFSFDEEKSPEQIYFDKFIKNKDFETCTAPEQTANYTDTIKALRTTGVPNKSWLVKNAAVIKKVFGIDFSKNTTGDRIAGIFENEILENRSRIINKIETVCNHEKLQFYKKFIPEIAVFDKAALRERNFVLSEYANPNYHELGRTPVIFRTEKALPDREKLQRITNAHIFDLRNKLDTDNFICTIERAYSQAEHLKDEKSENSIILVNDLYKYISSAAIQNSEYEPYGYRLNNAALNLDWMLNKLTTSNRTPRIMFISEEIEHSPAEQKGLDHIRFRDISIYGKEKGEFNKIKSSLEKHNTLSPKCIIVSSSTSDKDTEKFINAAINETGYYKCSNLTSSPDSSTGQPSAILLKDAYKHAAEIKEFMENTEPKPPLIIVTTNYPEKLLQKLDTNPLNTGNKVNYTLFKLNKPEPEELQKLFRKYIDSVDDEINSAITYGKNIKPVNLDMNYKEIADILSLNTCGETEIAELTEKAKNEYLSNPDKFFNNYLFENLIRGN